MKARIIILGLNGDIVYRAEEDVDAIGKLNSLKKKKAELGFYIEYRINLQVNEKPKKSEFHKNPFHTK